MSRSLIQWFRHSEPLAKATPWLPDTPSDCKKLFDEVDALICSGQLVARPSREDGDCEYRRATMMLRALFYEVTNVHPPALIGDLRELMDKHYAAEEPE